MLTMGGMVANERGSSFMEGGVVRRSAVLDETESRYQVLAGTGCGPQITSTRVALVSSASMTAATLSCIGGVAIAWTTTWISVDTAS